MSKPMFFYAGIYGNAGDAAADCADIQKLHGSKAIGLYDAQIIVRRPTAALESRRPRSRSSTEPGRRGRRGRSGDPVPRPASSRGRRRCCRLGVGAYAAHRPRHEPQGGQAHRREAGMRATRRSS